LEQVKERFVDECRACLPTNDAQNNKQVLFRKELHMSDKKSDESDESFATGVLTGLLIADSGDILGSGGEGEDGGGGGGGSRNDGLADNPFLWLFIFLTIVTFIGKMTEKNVDEKEIPPRAASIQECRSKELKESLSLSLSSNGFLKLQHDSRLLQRLTSFRGLPMPEGITRIDCSWMRRLTSLEGLPEGIKTVSCCGCDKLTSLEGLPTSVKEVYCNDCKNLASLKGLPEGIQRVFCGHCDKLTSLEGLPDRVKEVYCTGCPKGLDKLPASVKVIR
jgi:hypothetical protein